MQQECIAILKLWKIWGMLYQGGIQLIQVQLNESLKLLKMGMNVYVTGFQR